MSTGRRDVKRFYDDYVERQETVGVNDRHRAVVAAARRAGLGAGDRVLEIGCGIGTATELLAREVGERGSVLGVDISERSIEIGRERLQSLANVELRAVDVVAEDVDGTFDVVVLPDVIEHIPVEHHSVLFARVARWLGGRGFALLNYPNPFFIEWCREHRPDLLQIIDQPIHADQLVASVYPNDLYLDRYETYSIWIAEGDYISAVLRPRATATMFTEIPATPPSLARRGAGKVKRLWAR